MKAASSDLISTLEYRLEYYLACEEADCVAYCCCSLYEHTLNGGVVGEKPDWYKGPLTFTLVDKSLQKNNRTQQRTNQQKSF